MPGLEPIAPHRRPLVTLRELRVRFLAAVVLAAVLLAAAAALMIWLWPFSLYFVAHASPTPSPATA
jgi:hypothetical protein